jgi:hypothetical protein
MVSKSGPEMPLADPRILKTSKFRGTSGAAAMDRD